MGGVTFGASLNAQGGVSWFVERCVYICTGGTKRPFLVVDVPSCPLRWSVDQDCVNNLLKPAIRRLFLELSHGWTDNAKFLVW